MDSTGMKGFPDGNRSGAQAGGLAVLAMAAAVLSGNVCGQGTFKTAVMPTARTVQTEWKYTTADPGEDWVTADHADGDWNVGPGGFGSLGTPSAIVGTEWNSPDIWIRKIVNLADPASLNGLSLIIHHDENVQVFVNGKLIFQDTGYTRDYESVPLDLEAQNAFMAGDNLIAVHCSQTIGGQFIDVGLEAVVSGTATLFLADARTEPQEWKYSFEDPGTSTWAGGGFDDAAWSSAAGGFGSLGTAGAMVGKEWTTGNIWLRRTFEIGDEAYAHFLVTIHHDEDVMVAINGTTVLQMSSYSTDYAELDVTASATKAIKPGANIIAVYCRNTGGGQYIDVGLKGVIADPPVGLKRAEGKRAVRGSPMHGRSGTVLFAVAADGPPRLFGADGKRILPKR